MKVCARTMNAERRPRATDTATTGSFQNQPDAAVAAPPLKRKHGMSALLQDVTNLEDSDCRTARHITPLTCATSEARIVGWHSAIFCATFNTRANAGIPKSRTCDKTRHRTCHAECQCHWWARWPPKVSALAETTRSRRCTRHYFRT